MPDGSLYLVRSKPYYEVTYLREFTLRDIAVIIPCHFCDDTGEIKAMGDRKVPCYAEDCRSKQND